MLCALSHRSEQDLQLTLYLSERKMYMGGSPGLLGKEFRLQRYNSGCPTWLCGHPQMAPRGLIKNSIAFFVRAKGAWRSGAGTCLEAIGANLPLAELRGKFHPFRKSPDSEKANKREKEEALPFFPNSAPTTSHITNLQTNYLEPDILKNLPIQLSEYRKIKNRVLGSRLR